MHTWCPSPDCVTNPSLKSDGGRRRLIVSAFFVPNGFLPDSTNCQIDYSPPQGEAVTMPFQRGSILNRQTSIQAGGDPVATKKWEAALSGSSETIFDSSKKKKRSAKTKGVIRKINTLRCLKSPTGTCPKRRGRPSRGMHDQKVKPSRSTCSHMTSRQASSLQLHAAPT